VYSCAQTENQVVENNSDNQANKSVIDPIAGVDPGSIRFSVSATEMDTIFLENGGTVVFDANAFVDQNGNAVTGNVDVDWQEFHTLADIMASGIPMKYDSAGVAHDLVSGGMFTISASKNGEELRMAEGKGADVNLVSLQDTPCYNFYQLDEETGDWAYETTKNGEVVQEVNDSQVEAPGTLIETQLYLASYPELKNRDLIGWQTKKSLSDNEKNWLKQTTTKIRIAKRLDGEYYLLEAVDKSGKREIVAKPYTLRNALSDSKANKAELQKSIDEIADYQKRMAAGKVVRNIRINGFGTYNWDIINKRENSKPMFAQFEFPGEVNKSLVSVSLISPEENAVVNYDPNGAPKFSFDPNKKNILVGIMPNNELVIAKDRDFDAARVKENGSQHTFQLKKTGVILKSPEDIMNYLDRLI
jgi:hypothetical protein